jgi:hypothetical protein
MLIFGGNKMVLHMTDLYVRNLLEQGRDGWITVGTDHERFTYDVHWEEEREDELARDCVSLVARLSEAAEYLDRALPLHRKLTPEQQAVWETYLKPFPDHGLDRDALQRIWEKSSIDLSLDETEQELYQAYRDWYNDQALARLPWKGCSPSDLITRARRYARLVQLKAPLPVRANEARRLAEEFLLYH